MSFFYLLDKLLYHVLIQNVHDCSRSNTGYIRQRHFYNRSALIHSSFFILRHMTNRIIAADIFFYSCFFSIVSISMRNPIVFSFIPCIETNKRRLNSEILWGFLYYWMLVTETLKIYMGINFFFKCSAQASWDKIKEIESCKVGNKTELVKLSTTIGNNH